MAGIMKVFVGDTPQLAHALFFGMVLASVAVPVMEIKPEERSTGAQKGVIAGLFLVAAVAAFFLTGLGAGNIIESPPAWMIFGSAAIAICALVLPGISGSFMLKIFGLYVPTMAAVDGRNFGYLGLFAAGAAVGLGLFVKGLNWLLEHKHAATMAVMSGLLLGSLRAVWPWEPDGTPLAPDAPWPTLLGLALAGAIVVVGIVWVDRRLKRR
jgi:putative membrane protein